MEAIVISRALTTEETANIAEKAEKGKAVLYASVEVPNLLQGKTEALPELENELKKEINYRMMKKVLQFGDMLVDSKSVTEHLFFEQASIWHYHKFRIYFALRNMMYEVEQVNQLVGKFDRLIIYTGVAGIRHYYSDSQQVEIVLPKALKNGINPSTLLKYSVFFIRRSVKGFYQAGRLKGKKHVVIDHAIRQQMLNRETLIPMEGNYNLHYLFDRLDGDFMILDDKVIPKLAGQEHYSPEPGAMRSGINRLFGEYVLCRGVFSGMVRKQFILQQKRLLEIYTLLLENIKEKEGRFIIDQLIGLHSSSKLFLFKYLAYKKFFNRHEFQTITSIDENSPRIKSVLDAASSNQIFTVGIQHGTIHELHPAYMLTQKDIELEIIPDYTLVWGEYWSNFLQDKGNYPSSALHPVGQIRTDIIPALLELKSPDTPEIDTQSRTVVFASQPQRDPKIRERAALDVFNAVKKLDGVQLIIKLHPAEKKDKGYYEQLARKAGCANYSIIHKIDLYLLISQCDIMITCFSTVGAETVYFNKPLIILDHLKQDIQGYHREGIALQATNAEELSEFLKAFLEGSIKINKEAYQNYIEKYACKIDGRVSERVIRFIKGLGGDH